MVAVYIDGSGMTHLLDPVSSEVLLFLANTSRRPEEIVAKVRLLLDNNDITWEEIEQQVLRDLEAFGMVEALP